MSQDNIKSVIEALLFVSEKPLTLEQLKNVLDTLETNELREVLEELKTDYEKTNRGVRIAEIAGGFQMVTSADLSPFLKKFYKERRVERLSKPALETLAIIAYKQPVTRLEIESFRNVNVDGVIKSILDRNLVRIVGRKKAPGRPHVYGTTKQFLEYFGLSSIEDLPKIEAFKETQVTKEKVNDTKEPTQKS